MLMPIGAAVEDTSEVYYHIPSDNMSTLVTRGKFFFDGSVA
jgi:hypothetical protein